MTRFYQEQLRTATTQYEQLRKQYNTFALLRLIAIIATIDYGYQTVQDGSWVKAILAVANLVLFFLLIVRHKNISLQRQIAKAKININEQEIAFLEHRTLFADNGKEFAIPNHPFAHDLDVLGEGSLYQYLNRTHTFLGKKLLAKRMLSPTPLSIEATQQEIKALTPNLGWRQNFMAHTSLINDSAAFYQHLAQWVAAPTPVLPRYVRFLLWGLPVLLLSTLLLGYGWENEILKSLSHLLITVNLVVFLSFIGKMTKEKLGFERAYAMLYAFKQCIEQIETHFPEKDKGASKQIAQLSRLLDDLDSVSNILVSVPLNIFSFYHLHRYQALLQWKRAHAGEIMDWFEQVAETEVLCSFANYSYNHPDFAYPTLNKEYRIHFEAMGHPLIPDTQRICNDITLDEGHFVILTGSNMSGKSTFLRSLGVNMLLCQMGLPVCAHKADLHPLPLLVSMRLSDSLNEGQSYFFAEINRIQQIVEQLQQERCIVLLDEVLRGTNSEDKQYGTVKIIERLLSLKALGIVATHDITVCQLANHYPTQLQNLCFESMIVEGELRFDYRLREGVCQNKNATFLMKKLGIIKDNE